jgi:hypothetical protein
MAWRSKDTFVKVPLWWITEAAKATDTPAALVCIYLLHASWKAKSTTFLLPNGWFKQHGVSPKTKRRVLRDLAAAGLITVDWRPRKSPLVTLVVV